MTSRPSKVELQGGAGLRRAPEATVEGMEDVEEFFRGGRRLAFGMWPAMRLSGSSQAGFVPVRRRTDAGRLTHAGA
jgi:hypothetical protein